MHKSNQRKTNNRLTKHIAFTLAEVLITLAIIGIVAAMTIPTLISKYQEKYYLTKLLKIYSTFSQAYQHIQANEGSPNTWADYPDFTNAVTQSESASRYMFEKFKPYLKIAKDCGYEAGCFPNVTYKQYNGSDSINFLTHATKRYMIKLSDGSTIAFLGYIKGHPSGGFACIYIDLNGDSAPNQFGKDIFQFQIRENSLIPFGGANSENFMEQCYLNGYSCAQWVITRRNFEYWHCDDLIVGEKETCD